MTDQPAPIEARRAAADAFDAAHARTLDQGQITAAIADAVWPLALAEGRRSVAEAMLGIRVSLATLDAAIFALGQRPASEALAAREELTQLRRGALMAGLIPPEPTTCPRCRLPGVQQWIDVSTRNDPDAVMPGLLECRTVGCPNGDWSRRWMS